MGTGTGTGNFSFFLVVSEPVSEKFGIGKIWYRKKYRYRYRKHLVPEKKVSVSFNILGTVTHCCTVSAIIVTKIIFCALKYTLSYTLSLLQKYWLHLEEINWDDQGGGSIGVLPGSPTGGFSLSMGFPQILGSPPGVAQMGLPPNGLP